jgi:diguanylate cyclase (GGDEF)-like protein
VRLSAAESSRFSLVAAFAAVTLVPVVALGFGLSLFLRHEISSRKLADVRQAASLVGQSVAAQISPYQLEHGFDGADLISIDAIGTRLRDGGVVRMKIWDRRGKILYSDDRALIGSTFPLEDDLRSALRGTPAADVSDLDEAENIGERDLGASKLYEVYAPLPVGSKGAIPGVLELYFPYAPLAHEIDHAVTTTYLILFGGLLVLWVSMLRLTMAISRRLRRQADENRRLALHDQLTELPNRALFLERVRDALEASRRSGGSMGVLLLDLDRFKEVNDTLGHHCGDELLNDVAQRLQSALRPTDTVARLGGDEFAVVIPGAAEPGLVAVAGRILLALEHPFVLDGLPLDVEASVGIAIAPEHGEDVETLLQRADVAMYAAKEARARYAVYDPATDDNRPERLTMIGELRRALEARELVLHYQPKARLADRAVTSVEALIRWQHPTRGFVPPDEFVPLVEHTALIRPLTSFVLDEAMRQCAEWRSEGIELSVSINVATRNVLDSNFPDEVAAALERHAVPADALEIELTETSVLADPRKAQRVMERLRAMGVKLSIDDFGRGYSSLSYLSELPIEVIKIDRSFVLGMDTNEHQAKIVQSTIHLGRSLSLEVVAEGVETSESWNRLLALGCDSAQGYFLARPLPPEQLGPWLHERLGDQLAV